MIPIALPVTRFQWPNNWDASFFPSGSLNVEVGFGTGQFLVHMAQHRRGEYFVGLEISLPSIRNGEKKVARAKLENICLVRATAQSALWLLFLPGTISTLTINFPDPWPKASHQHRRVVSDKFLNLAASRMIQGGKLDIATDHSDYAGWIAERLARSPYFESDLPAVFTTRDQHRIPTKYELKAIDAGHKCYYFKWSRNSILSAETFTPPEEYVMPHIVLQLPIGLDEIEDRFESKQFADGTTKVQFIALYHSTKVNMVVVDTFIHEEPLEQRVLLSIAHRKAGDYLVSLHDAGYPRSTRGIHLAVHWLAEWLQGLSVGGKIVRHNLQLDG
jgi:tRNA (guanine-N7-)-methyltransferase